MISLWKTKKQSNERSSYGKNYFDNNEASEYTGIGRTNLRQLITWNKIPIIKIGNKILIRCITLEHFLKVNEGNNLKNKYEVVAV